MNVNKLVVHELDSLHRRMILAINQVNLVTSMDIEGLLIKLVKAVQSSNATSKALLEEESILLDIVNTEFDFMEYSRIISKAWFQELMLDEAYTSSNVIFAQVDQGDTTLLVFLEMTKKSATIKLEHDFITNDDVLGSTLSTVKNAFVFDLTTSSLLIKTSSEMKDVMEEILNCHTVSNSVNSFTVLNKITHDVSENRNEDPVLNILKLKQTVTDNVNFIDTVQPFDLINAVFNDFSEPELEIINNAIEEHNMSDDIVLKQLKRTSLASKHKIVTESGVEIIIPVDSVNVDNIITIDDTSDGTNINLHNVGKIVRSN